MALPYVITILVTSGEPDGVRVIEKSNWTGRGLQFSRSDLAAALEEGIDSPGIYVLIGEDPDEEFDSQIYVGQGENVGKRLKQHQGDDAKDFWSTTVVFVSANNSLNRAHISHLESSLIELANASKQARVKNGNQPAVPSMSAADQAMSDGFLREMLAIFPVLGVSAFDEPQVVAVEGVRRYSLVGPKAQGQGEERATKFVVLAGSTARLDEVASLGQGTRRLRQQLIKRGVLTPEVGGQLIFVEDVPFRSPSMAASVLLARNANGRTEWVDDNGVTLKDHQIAELDSVE